MAARCDSSGETGGREDKSMRRFSLAGRKLWGVICCPALAGVLMVWASAHQGTFMRFRKTEIGPQRGTELEAWSSAVSTFVGAVDGVGWGTRTGGVIVAGTASKVCDVQFKGNALQSTQEFEANAAMVADGGESCKAQLEKEVKGGWHKGQVFYYRLGVDRPGYYTVRLSLVFYHNDERRADAIKLNLSDLIEVRLQCVVSSGRFVVPIKKIAAIREESIGVVEFDTVAFDGEILLEIEGIYTCIGLSLVETFSHEEQQQPLRVPSIIGKGEPKPSEDVGVDGAGRVDNSDRMSETMVALEEAWKRAGPVCARRYMEEATQRTSHQRGSVSREAINQQRYFDEWARRERLEESCGRFCKPHSAPRFGEQGWTWAGHSERVQRGQDKKKSKWTPQLEEQDPAMKVIFQAAVEAGLKEGVSPGTATALAAEAVDRAIKESEGSTLSPTATRQAVNRVARASKALVMSRNRVANRLPQPQPQSAVIASAGDAEKEDGGQQDRAPSQTESGGMFIDGGKGDVQEEGWEGGKVERLVTTKKGSVAVGRITPPKENPGKRRRLSVSADSDGALEKLTSMGEGLDLHELGRYVDNDGIDAEGPRSARRRMDTMKTPAGDGASSSIIILPSRKTPPNPVGRSVGGDDSRGWRVDPSNPMPPPMCPSRLAELLEEALNVAAGKSDIPRAMNVSGESGWSERGGGMGAIDRWLGGSQGSIVPTWLEWAFHGGGRVSVQQQLALRSLRSGFKAIAAYRAHDTAKGIEAKGVPLENGEDEPKTLPLRLTGFTWDGVTVVAKETVPGCARVAQPAIPIIGPEGDWASSSTYYNDDASDFFWEEFEDVDLDPTSSNMLAGDGDGEKVDGKKGDAIGGGKRPCLRVEGAMVPTVATVVDIIVPVSAGLVPRLLTLLPQMERLAKGKSCNPFPPSHPLAPQCEHPDHYAPAFWPERLTRRGHEQGQGQGPSSESSFLYNAFASISVGNKTSGLRGGAGHEKGNWSNFRVVVSSDDSRVEAMLSDYDVDTVFVQSSSPFSKAQAIQDASQVIPDDHILLVHDADLFPPCGLPDALRQTVVRGVQAVNLLLPYENQPEVGKCMYPLSTFGPMAMYASDFRTVGGIADANQGRWGYEDTAFLHKVMLGDKALGVLRVHLPGLVHRWHEVTPWKCMVWTWGGPPSAQVTSS